MKLILVRHGETDWVHRKLYQGMTDVPLNPRGLIQAKHVAQAIKREQPFAVYCSKLVRVRKTAQLIAAACRQKPIVDARLNEVSFGKWEGRAIHDIRSRFPKAVDDWYEARWDSRPTGGESLKSLAKRVSSFMNQIFKKHGRRDGTCVLVTHGGPIRMILIQLLQIPVGLFWQMRVDPASISVVNVKGQKHEIVLLNSQAHLNGFRTTWTTEEKERNK